MTAKATDNLGAITSSSAISVIVNGSTANGPINFVYDENGRLVGVSDVNGASARYQYDSVGNIVRIGRGNAGDVTILGFSPATGPVGTNVTISGTGFSTTTSDNAVRFAGRAANILTATATQLTVSVPAGAVDGPIGVTTPSGSATTSANFIVAGSSNLPTITSFTPTSGGPGTSITITGTNFDPAVDYNRVSVNGKAITLTSANATTLVGTVPAGATSGKISVLTPRGVATSGQYLYVAPTDIESGSIETTGTITVGDTATVTTSTVGGTGLRIFEGTKGQHLLISIVDANFANCTRERYGYLSIYDSNGQKLASLTACGNEMLDFVLPTSGAYSMVVDPFGTDSGSLTFILNNAPADITGTVLLDGSTTTVTTTSPGQNVRLSFFATAGQRIVTRPLSFTFNYCTSLTARMLGPDGQPLEGDFNFCGNIIPSTLIPRSGLYSVLIDPSGAETGTLSLSLEAVPDITGSIAIGGAPVSVYSSVVGQNALLTFSATVGQSVFLRISSGTCTTASFIQILQGSRVLGSSPACNPYGFGPIAITASGTYVIAVRPAISLQTPVSLSLTDATPVKDAIVIGGGSVTASLPNLGQVARFEFNGSVGQHVKLTLNSSTTTKCILAQFFDPSNQLLRGNCLNSGGSAEATLGSTGKFTVVLTPPYDESGNVIASLSEIVDLQNAISIGGPPVPVTIGVPEQNAQLYFTASAGQRAYVKVNSSALGNCSPGQVRVVPTDGLENTTVSNLCPQSYTDPVKFQRSGTYILSVDPYAGNTGSVSVSLIEPLPDVTVNIAIDAPSVSLTTSIFQKARLNFSGSAGQVVRVSVAGSTYTKCYFSIFDPNGPPVGNDNWFHTCDDSDPLTLMTTGNYAVAIETRDQVGSANWAVTSVTEVLGTITADGITATTNTGVAGQIARLAFSGTGGQHVKLQVMSSTYSNCQGTVKIIDSSGNALQQTTNNCAGGLINTLLPVTGPYSILITPRAAEMGAISLRLTTISDEHSTITVGGAPVLVHTFGSDANAILDFAGVGGQRISAAVSNSTYTNCSSGSIQLLDPGITVLSTGSNGVCSGAFVEPLVLPTSGNYKALLDVTNVTSGSAMVSLYNVPADVSGTLEVAMPATNVAIGTPGQNAKMSFSSSYGELRTVHITNNTVGCAFFTLHTTDGLFIDFVNTCLTNFDLPTFTPLPGSTLNYILEIDPQGPATGSMDVRVSSP